MFRMLRGNVNTRRMEGLDIKRKLRDVGEALAEMDAENVRARIALSVEADKQFYNLQSWAQEPSLAEASERGIEIPESKYEPERRDKRQSLLTPTGFAWLRRQIRQSRLSEAKDWVGVLLPPLSLIVAILSLLVALHKK